MIKLLVVDDSALMRKLMGTIFEAEGDFEIRFARDGIEALDEAVRFRPDVVTLDVTMPVMDGLACLGRLMVETPCPVVMVSSHTSEGAEATLDAMRLGAVDFVVKPAGTVSLSIDRIRPLLVEKVRAAAKARLRRSLHLVERVRHQVGRAQPVPRPAVVRRAGSMDAIEVPPAPGGIVDGLLLIGASTGGPRALDSVLSVLPASFPWPILVAQHMPASFTSVFARRLDGICALNVVEVTRPTPLRAGYVYVGQGDADVVVASRPGGLVALSVPASPAYPWHPSTDRLVASALDHVAARHLVGVLVTGMGADGAEAMARLHAEGGRTIAEDESTAVVWGMPGELVRRGGADVVAPLHDIADEILRMVA